MRLLLCFQKHEAVRHLAHLDLLRTMQRALRRSGLPVRYSQGFHPHMLTSFASALSMGVSSEAEILDVALAGEVQAEECLQKINAVLPPALTASQASLVDDAHPALMKLLKQASYRVTWMEEVPTAFLAEVQAFLEESEVLALRKSKRGETMVNIRPMVHALAISAGFERTEMQMRLSLEEVATLKPELLIETLATRAGIEMPKVWIHRTGLFGLSAEGQAVPLMA